MISSCGTTRAVVTSSGNTSTTSISISSNTPSTVNLNTSVTDAK